MTQCGPAPRALVLAAGLGSRLRGIAGDLPKPLLPIGGEPILARNLRWLSQGGVREVVINLHFEPDAVRAEIGDGAAMALRVSYVHEPVLLGTAGALANIADVFAQTMLVVYGDNLVHFDLQALLDRHAASGALATLALFDQDRNLHTGIAGGRVLLDVAGVVTAFVEGGPQVSAGLVNAGVYVVEPDILDLIPRRRLVDFGREVFPAMLAQGLPVAGHVIEPAGYCLGLDTPESFAAGQALLDQGRLTS